MKLRITFTLKTGVLGESPILAKLNYGYKELDVLKNIFKYKPLIYYTGIKVDKAQWDSKSRLPYDRSKQADIENISKKIEDIFNYLLLKNNNITPEIFKQELDEKLRGKTTNTIVKKVRIVDFINEEIITSTSLKASSIVPYKGLAKKLMDFEEKIGKPLYSNELNEDLYKQFMEGMKSQLNKINAVWAVQKVFKSTLHEIARRYKIPVFDPAQELSNKDRIQPVSADSIYLNFEQIQKIIEYKPATEKLKNTKLILLTLLFTGCRQSDVHKISLEHLYDKNGEKFYYCQYFSEKTDTEIIVPILKPLLEAIKENEGKPSYPITQQKFNNYVKELVEACGLDDVVTITFMDATGKKQFETKKLYQFVTSHVGRRSFVTNLINHIPITTLTKITGHTLKDTSIIFGYNKISLLDNAVLFRKQLRRAVEENGDYFLFELT
jgi:integrase